MHIHVGGNGVIVEVTSLKAGSHYDTSYAEIEYFRISACINALMQMCANTVKTEVCIAHFLVSIGTLFEKVCQ